MARVMYTELPTHQKLCLVALADHANDDGCGIWAGQRLIAHKVSAGDRAARATLKQLRDDGWIMREAREGAHGTDRYRILIERLPTSTECQAIRQRLRDSASTGRGLPPGRARPPGSLRHVDRTSTSGVDRTSTPGVDRVDRTSTSGVDRTSTSGVDRTSTSGKPSVETSEEPKEITGARRRRPTNPEADARVRPVLDHFCQAHQAALGEAYPVVGGRDGTVIKRLPQSYDVAKLCALIDRFFASLGADDFVREKIGATVPAFVGKISALLGQGKGSIAVSASRPTQSRLPDFEITEEMIQGGRKYA